MATIAEYLQVVRLHPERRYMIIIDDNMFLRSMRREVYVLARDAQVPMLVFYCDLPIERCSERNAQHQESAIPKASFENIASKFQKPDPRFIFDRNIFRHTEDKFNRCAPCPLVNVCLSNIVVPKMLRDDAEAFIRFAKVVVDSYRPGVSKPTREQEESSKSALKKLDEQIRKEVAELMAAVDGKVRSNLGKPLAKLKEHITIEARSLVATSTELNEDEIVSLFVEDFRRDAQALAASLG